MAIDALLSRLEGVRPTGAGRWIARCPAHGDRSPSLSIRELDDGRVLLHDFAGCSTEEILGAVDLTFDALFPEQPIALGKRERRPFNAADVLETVAAEAALVAVAAANLRGGVTLSDNDRARLLVAAERLNEARRLTHG